MKINMKSWLFKIPVFSVFVFILSSIMLVIILNPFHFERLTDDNTITYFSGIIVPSFIIMFLFNREINAWKSTLFGGFIGFFGGQIWFTYWVITTAIHLPKSADYSLLPIVWFLFSFLFIISCLCGALLSYVIRKYHNKILKQQ